MDVRMVKPFYYRGELWAYLSNTGHWSDTGGMVPGGFCATATEIQQEGLRLPPIHLVRRGELVDDVVDVIMSNIRVPEERLGDMRAQLGALSIGEQRLSALLDKYGETTVSAVIAEMRKRSETLMRAHIETIPDGTYSFSAFVDSDGITDDILEVALDARVDGSDIHFDYSRSSPPCRGPLNSVWATTMGSTLCGMKHIFADVPINSGCFAPIHIEPPHGTFLFAEYPRPVWRVRGGSLAADHGGPVRCARPGDSRGFVRGSGGHQRQLRPRRFRSRIRPELRDVHLHRRRLRRLERRRRRIERDVHHRHLEEPAHRGAGGSTSRCCSRPTSCAKAAPAPGDGEEGLGVSYKVRLLRGDAKASFMMDHGRTGPFGMLGGEPGALNDISGLAERRAQPSRLRLQG